MNTFVKLEVLNQKIVRTLVFLFFIENILRSLITNLLLSNVNTKQIASKSKKEGCCLIKASCMGLKKGFLKYIFITVFIIWFQH